MTEEERQVFKQDLRKVKTYSIIVIVALVLILGFAQKCNSDKINRLQGEYKQLEIQYLEQKVKTSALEAVRILEKDSLNFEISKREGQNSKLIAENKELDNKINDIKSKPIILPKDSQGLVNYYNDRYTTKENKLIEDKIGLTTNVAYQVSHELEEKDKLEEILPLKDTQLFNKDLLILNLNKDKEDYKTQLSSSEVVITEYKVLEKNADKNISNLKEQVNKLETKSLLNKILIPASAIIGGYVGYKIGEKK